MDSTVSTFVYSLATLAGASFGYIYSRRTISNSRIPKRGNGDDLEATMLEKQMVSSVASLLEEKLPVKELDLQLEEPQETISQVERSPSTPPSRRPHRSFLKRKSIDDHYPVADQKQSTSSSDGVTLIPCKRTKTPTNDTDGGDDAKFENDYLLVQLRSTGNQQEIEVIDLSVPASPPPSEDADTDHEEDGEMNGPGSEGEPVVTAPTTPQADEPEPDVDVPRATTPPLLAEVRSTSPKIVSPSPVKTLPRGFASFAGPSSGFQSWGGGGSAFQATAGQALVFSPWRTASSSTNVPNPFLSSPLGSSALESPPQSRSSEKVAVVSKAQPNQPTTLTGEENEDIVSEIKGVRLYVKRGDKEFSSPGMLGTLRLLSDQTDSSAERLLFRREPLWQVSVNLRVNKGVRCAFDREESVLRLTLKESAATGEDESGKQEVVVYAFKPGKSTSKQDFVEFGERLVGNERFMRL